MRTEIPLCKDQNICWTISTTSCILKHFPCFTVLRLHSVYYLQWLRSAVWNFSPCYRYRLTNEGCLLAETLINQRPNPTLDAHMSISSPTPSHPGPLTSSQPAASTATTSTTAAQTKTNRGRKPVAAASHKTTCSIQVWYDVKHRYMYSGASGWHDW